MALAIVDRITKLQAALRGIPVNHMLQTIAIEAKPIIEDKVIAQLDEGIASDGEKISPPYSPFTKAMKKAEGKPYDKVTLNNTGAFRKGETAEVTVSGFEMINTDSKWGKITEKYGDVTDLTKKSKEELVDEVFRPYFFVALKEYFARITF
jgi:hypothetical protein